jgi:hypothetical protein
MSSFTDILQENPNLTIDGFQRLLEEYDKRFIDNKFSGFDKIRHTYTHLGKLIGRIADYVHEVEEYQKGNGSVEDIEIFADNIKKKVIPDLQIYAAWLSREFGVRMVEADLTRFLGNIKRFHADKMPLKELGELEKCVADKLKKTS